MGIATTLFSSILGSNAQKKAADRAADVSENSTQQIIDLARETRDGQIERSEPFRQLELQQGNALGEVFGFNPVGDAAPQQAQAQPQQTARDFSGFNGAMGGTRFNPRSGGFINGAASRILDERGAEPNFNDFLRGRSPQGQSGGTPQPQGQPQQAQPQISPNGINTSAQDAARERFEGSMFNDVYRQGHARDVDRIDAGLGASGLAFSGARMQAVEDARADRFGNTFNSYMASLMGQAPQAATNSQNAAAGAFGANASNAMAQNSQNQQNSAYARGNATAGLWRDVAGIGGQIDGMAAGFMGGF